MRTRLCLFSCYVTVLYLLSACQKELGFENNTVSRLPVLSTTAVSGIATTSATSGGTISNDGGSAILVRGVCWSLTPDPSVNSDHTTDGTGTGTYTSTVTPLIPSTTYYVRAYATNGFGTAYGNELIFVSLSAPPGLPTILTPIASAISSTSATCGGHVISDGGSPVTVRGICWGLFPNPDLSGTHSNDGSGLGAYSTPMTPLVPATIYYVRAYASNANGTAYGNEINFTTKP